MVDAPGWSAMPAGALSVDAERLIHPLGSGGAASVRLSRRLADGRVMTVAGIVVGVLALLLLLLACLVFCRWRRRLRLMRKTVKDFSSDVLDVEAQTMNEATTTTGPSRPSSGGNPPPHPPMDKLGTRSVVSAIPPSPHSSSSSEKRPRGERSAVSALLPTPTNQKSPKGMAPTPPIPDKAKRNRVEATRAAALPAIPIKTIKTKQNRVEDGAASPMTAMSTGAPSTVRGDPPTGWEHESADSAQAPEHRRKASSLAGKVPGSFAEDGGPLSVTRLQQRSASFERARGAIIGFDLDIPEGTLDSASGSIANGSGSGTRAALAGPAEDSSSSIQRTHRNMRSDSACDSVTVDPNANLRSDSASGSVAKGWPRTSRKNTVGGDDSMRDASAPSQSSFNPSQRSIDDSGGAGEWKTLKDVTVFESFASLPHGRYVFDSSSSAGVAGLARANARSVLAAPSFNSSRKTRHLALSPIDGLFSRRPEGGSHRARVVGGDAVVPEVAGPSPDLRATFRHRRSKTDFPSSRGGGIDFRWDSAAGSAFRESGADNFCSVCLGTRVQYDSASGSVLPASSAGTPGTAGLPRRRSSSRLDGGGIPRAMSGKSEDGADVENFRSGGVRCNCVRDPSGRSFGEGRRTMHGGRERSFSASSLPREAPLSRAFGKE